MLWSSLLSRFYFIILYVCIWSYLCICIPFQLLYKDHSLQRTSYARVSGTQEEQFTCSSRKNKGLSVLTHAMFLSSITNSTNQIGLRAFKELQNTVLKQQSTVSRHYVWAVKRTANSSEQQNFEDFFPTIYFWIIFISKTEKAKSRRWCRRRMPEWGLKIYNFEVQSFWSSTKQQ